MYRCPKCKSANIETTSIMTLPPERMRCEDCGFSSLETDFETVNLVKQTPAEFAIDQERALIKEELAEDRKPTTRKKKK